MLGWALIIRMYGGESSLEGGGEEVKNLGGGRDGVLCIRVVWGIV